MRWDTSGAQAIEFAEPTFPRRWNYTIEAAAQNEAGTAVGSAAMSDVIMSRGLGTQALRWDEVDVTPTVLNHLGASALGYFGASAVWTSTTQVQSSVHPSNMMPLEFLSASVPCDGGRWNRDH